MWRWSKQGNAPRISIDAIAAVIGAQPDRDRICAKRHAGRVLCDAGGHRRDRKAAQIARDSAASRAGGAEGVTVHDLGAERCAIVGFVKEGKDPGRTRDRLRAMNINVHVSRSPRASRLDLPFSRRSASGEGTVLYAPQCKGACIIANGCSATRRTRKARSSMSRKDLRLRSNTPDLGHGAERPVEISNQIIRVFDTDRQAHQRIADPRRPPLLRRDRRVRHDRRMLDQAVGASETFR